MGQRALRACKNHEHEDVEGLMDAHVLEGGFSPRELRQREDLDDFAMDWTNPHAGKWQGTFILARALSSKRRGE